MQEVRKFQNHDLRADPAWSMHSGKMESRHTVDVARGAQVAMPPKALAYIVILCFERRYPTQNSVIRLKSNLLTPPKFWPG